MPQVLLPKSEDLIRDILEMLQVLNSAERRRERYGLPGPRAKIPTSQLEERARNIAQMILLLPPV